MIVSHLLLILHKKIQFYIFMFEMWQKVAKFKGAEYFRKALYVYAWQYTDLKLHPVWTDDMEIVTINNTSTNKM